MAVTQVRRPCRGCPDGKVSVSLREFRRLQQVNGRYIEIVAENKRLRDELRLRDAWREPGYTCGYQLVHNPEHCDECYRAQLSKDRAFEEAEDVPAVPLDGSDGSVGRLVDAMDSVGLGHTR